MRERVDAAFIIADEFRRGTAADFFDPPRRQPGICGNRRMDVPLEPGAPERAGDEDRKVRQSRLEGSSVTVEYTERLRKIGQCRRVEPNAQRTLHHTAWSGDDRVIDALALFVESIGMDIG